MDNVFINNFINSGISNYLLIKDNKDYEKEHIFEVHIIKCLCKIYGEINIINPYRIKNENSFKSNIIMYGYKLKDMEEFFKLLDDYTEWLNSEKAVGKTDVTSKIEISLINMIIEKNKEVKFDKDEIEYFNAFFDPVNNNLAKLHDLITVDINKVPMYWNEKKELLKNTTKLKLVKKDLLSSSTYEKYGLEQNDVAKMSEDKVKDVNESILEKEKEEQKRNKKFVPKSLIITSGNGFVDILMLLSIMTTEIVIGVLIALYFIRG